LKEIIVTARNIDDAMDKAVIQLNVDRDLVEFEILDTPTSGFMGFGAKPARILARTGVRTATEAQPKKENKPTFNKNEANKKSDFVKKEATPNKVEDKRATALNKGEVKKEATQNKVESASNEVPTTKFVPKREETAEEQAAFVPTENGVAFVEGYLVDLFKNMDLKVNATVTQKGRIIEVKLLGEDVGLVIGKHGDTLDAIQHIAQLAFNKKTNGAEKVRIDTEDYREKREKTLVGLAKSIANRVIKSKGKYELEPMKAYERRIIHATLQNYPMITTYSIGDDQQRRIVVAFKTKDSN
jgi:spoIIIJ-associated protein